MSMKSNKVNVGKTEKNNWAVGLSSEVGESNIKKHILGADIDCVELSNMMTHLEEIAQKYSLSHFILFASSPNSYHVYNIGVRHFKQQVEIIDEMIKRDLIEEYWKEFRLKECRFVLRVSDLKWKEAPKPLGVQTYDIKSDDTISSFHKKYFEKVHELDLSMLSQEENNITTSQMLRYE